MLLLTSNKSKFLEFIIYGLIKKTQEHTTLIFFHDTSLYYHLLIYFIIIFWQISVIVCWKKKKILKGNLHLPVSYWTKNKQRMVFHSLTFKTRWSTTPAHQIPFVLIQNIASEPWMDLVITFSTKTGVKLEWLSPECFHNTTRMVSVANKGYLIRNHNYLCQGKRCILLLQESLLYRFYSSNL